MVDRFRRTALIAADQDDEAEEELWSPLGFNGDDFPPFMPTKALAMTTFAHACRLAVIINDVLLYEWVIYITSSGTVLMSQRKGPFRRVLGADQKITRCMARRAPRDAEMDSRRELCADPSAPYHQSQVCGATRRREAGMLTAAVCTTWSSSS